MMGDGHLNKCKSCVKLDVTENRSSKRDYYLAYDKVRAKSQKRILAREMYIKTDHGKKAVRRCHENYARRFPLKIAASNLFWSAFKRGDILKPNSCSNCNRVIRLEAHHDDYAKPLEIRWLCKKCHTEWHLNNKAINGE
jgi:ribosomal protein S27AE